MEVINLIKQTLTFVILLYGAYEIGVIMGYSRALARPRSSNNDFVILPASEFKLYANARAILGGNQHSAERHAISDYLAEVCPTDCKNNVNVNNNHQDSDTTNVDPCPCAIWKSFESKVWHEWTYNRTLPDLDMKNFSTIIVSETAKIMPGSSTTECSEEREGCDLGLANSTRRTAEVDGPVRVRRASASAKRDGT